MNRFLLSTALMLSGLAASAQGTMTLTTAAEPGTKVRVLPNAMSATQPITIDWGNGIEMKYTVDPKAAAYNRWIDGTIEGTTIKVKGNLTEFSMSDARLTSATLEMMASLKKLELSKNELTSFKIMTPTPLENLNLSYNCLKNSPTVLPTMTLENCGGTLTNLNLSHNTDLECLDMRDLSVLEYLTLNDCPRFASIFICLPEDKHTSLRSINIENCSLSHFYPINLPALRTLSLGNNILMSSADDEPFVLGDYPELTRLSVNGNKGIKNLDVTKCTKLEQLWIDSCAFTTIDISQCPSLINLNCAANNIRTLDLGNNASIKSLNVSGNPMTELDTEPLKSLTDLNISNTQISFVNLMNAYYLQTFTASNSRIAFVDFNGQQPGRMYKIDMRNCKEFTPESMNYTLMTLPESKKVYSTNLWLAGSNAEHANVAYATGSDLHWLCDVTGDGTAQNSPLIVSLQDATDTGENKTGKLDRLYPLMAYSLEYDLDVMQTSGGKFIICQWQPTYFQTIKSVGNTALKGVPIHIYPYPEEGKRFKSVTVDGKEIFSRWFIVSDNSTIKVNFTAEKQSIAFDVKKGQDFTFLVNTSENNGTVEVDWGTGTRMPYTGQRQYNTGYAEIGGTRIDGTAAADKITVYGDIAAIDISGFGDVAADFGLWDNHVTGVDLTNCPDLKFFNAYWNPISTIDLSKNTALEVLDLSFTNLKNINLSANKNLLYLEAYSDGFGGGDGIDMISSIDLTNQPMLQYVNLKNHNLTSIDLTKAPYLRWLNLNGNKMTSIDVSKNVNLQDLNLGRNKLTSVDLSANQNLVDLILDDNELTVIDLSANTGLKSVYVGNNAIKSLDLSALKGLQRISITGNGLNPDELNDIYYKLPVRVDDGSDEDSKLSYNLLVYQAGDKVANEATRADSSIAEDRQWTPNQVGSNGGAKYAYLDILPASYGSFTVSDEKGNTYGHGSRVPKYEPLTITATPDDGYVFKSYSLNDEGEIQSTKFDMPGIYTKLKVKFEKGDSGVSVVDSEEGVSVCTIDGGVEINAEGSEVSIYTAAGVCVANGNVDGREFFSLSTGFYIVQVSTDGNITTKTIMVK